MNLEQIRTFLVVPYKLIKQRADLQGVKWRKLIVKQDIFITPGLPEQREWFDSNDDLSPSKQSIQDQLVEPNSGQEVPGVYRVGPNNLDTRITYIVQKPTCWKLSLYEVLCAALP